MSQAIYYPDYDLFTSILEKRYFSEEVLSSLKTVGFREVSIHEPQHGYIYFVSRK